MDGQTGRQTPGDSKDSAYAQRRAVKSGTKKETAMAWTSYFKK